MTRNPVTLASAIQFVVLSCLAWICAFTLLAFVLAGRAPDAFATAPSLWQAIENALLVIIFACAQRWLMRRYLRAQLRRWLYYSIAGALAGVACYIVFRHVVPNPSEFWQLSRLSPPLDPFYLFVKQVYFGISDFFRYGLVAFFQVFALQRQWRGRRLWLLAAILAAPLWTVSSSIVSVMILSLALAYIAAAPRRKRF